MSMEGRLPLGEGQDVPAGVERSGGERAGARIKPSPGRRDMNVYPDAPGHRNVDTSIAAANGLAPKLGRLQRMAETAIRNAGLFGLTADELAARLEMDRYSIQPRTSAPPMAPAPISAIEGESKLTLLRRFRTMPLAKHRPPTFRPK